MSKAQKNLVLLVKLVKLVILEFLESIAKKKGNRNRFPLKKLAATYFSTNKCSIIGDVRLNFSVRNGKR